MQRARSLGALWMIVVVYALLPAVYAHTGGTQEDQAQPSDTVIEVWAWGRMNDRIETHVVPRFLEEHPGVEFEFTTIAEEDIIQQILNRVGAGADVPDIIAANDSVAPVYMHNQVVVPINEPVELLDMSEFVPYKVGNGTWNGTVYGNPWDPAPVVRIYRDDLYREAGIDPTAVHTWDDFIEAWLRLRENGVYIWNLPREGMWWQWFKIVLNSYGGQFYDENQEVAIDSPEAVEALNTLRRIKDADITADFGNDRSQGWFAALQEGRLATVIQATWYVGSVISAAPDTAGLWRFTDVPDPVGREGLETFSGGSSFFIVRGHDTDRELLVSFLRAFNEAQLDIYKDSGILTGYLPDYDDPAFEERSDFFGGERYNAFVLEQAQAVPQGLTNYTVQWREAVDIIEQGLVPFFDGRKSAQETLTDIADQMRALQ